MFSPEEVDMLWYGHFKNKDIYESKRHMISDLFDKVMDIEKNCFKYALQPKYLSVFNDRIWIITNSGYETKTYDTGYPSYELLEDYLKDAEEAEFVYYENIAISLRITLLKIRYGEIFNRYIKTTINKI